jgi:hypothetical protein
MEPASEAFLRRAACPERNHSPEDWMMALWSSSAAYSTGVLWGPAVPPPVPTQLTQTTNRHTQVKRKFYYPTKVAEQPAWHFNYADQLEALGVGMGLVLADVTASANDSRQLGYAIGAWLNTVREFGPGATGQIDVLKYGSGNVVFTLPDFLAPDPPAGMTPVLPGALSRVFRYVRTVKAVSGYTEGKGLLLGVVGEEIPPPPLGPPPAPRISLLLGQLPEQQQVLVKFFKDGHQGIWLESRRGTGPWEFLITSTQSPYMDNRPLLVPGQAEVREYRAMFWDKGVASGDWCAVQKITVSP